LLALYRFQYRCRVFKPYVNQFHRKAFSLLNSIRALNGLPSLNNRQAQINNSSHSARITFSAILKNAGGSAYASHWPQEMMAFVSRSLEVQGFANTQKLRTIQNA
jgi:hypothetical protein